MKRVRPEIVRGVSYIWDVTVICMVYVKKLTRFPSQIPAVTHKCYTTKYWWFAYDVIKTSNANFNDIALNSEMVYNNIQRVSIPHLKLFGQIKVELWAKEVGEFSVM